MIFDPLLLGVGVGGKPLADYIQPRCVFFLCVCVHGCVHVHQVDHLPHFSFMERKKKKKQFNTQSSIIQTICFKCNLAHQHYRMSLECGSGFNSLNI